MAYEWNVSREALARALPAPLRVNVLGPQRTITGTAAAPYHCEAPRTRVFALHRGPATSALGARGPTSIRAGAEARPQCLFAAAMLERDWSETRHQFTARSS